MAMISLLFQVALWPMIQYLYIIYLLMFNWKKSMEHQVMDMFARLLNWGGKGVAKNNVERYIVEPIAVVSF